jgi:Bacterial PH domain
MAGQIERFHPQAPKELDRYLIPSEQIIFLIRRHWIVLFEPIASAVAGLVVLAFVSQRIGGPLDTIALVLWGLLVLRLLATLLDWWRKLFLATDRRLMQVSGIVTRQVDIMPMSKVTDMRYDRTLTGQLFGYGVYILESAGQDQALSKINFVPDPDHHYQEISAVIFAPAQRRLSDKLVPASTGSKIPISEPEQAWWRRS